MGRTYDVIVFGATGDAGRATARYLAANRKSCKVAIAGRNEKKLKALAEKFDSEIGIVIADAGDAASMRAMAAQTKVVIAAAGPFLELGEAAVEACIASGAHYCDISGEVHWVAEMEAKHGAAASSAKVCLVSLAGYDCVPDETSVFLAKKALEGAQSSLEGADVECCVQIDGGGMPAGTAKTTLACMGIGPALRFMRGWLAFTGRRGKLDMVRMATMPSWSSTFSAFTVPHFMAPMNIAVVHRSLAAQGVTTLNFRDRHLLAGSQSIFTCKGALYYALALMAAMCFGPIVVLAILLPPVRRRIEAMLDARSYAGDSKAAFKLTTTAVAKDGRARAVIKFAMAGDPGIFATAHLVSQTAMCMSERAERLPSGFMTPVVAVGGDALSERLRASGVKIDVVVTKRDGTRALSAGSGK